MTAATPPEWITLTPTGVVLTIKAVPRSRATRAVGLQDGALRVQIAAAPHRGQSNAALCAYLAECAGVRPSAVGIRRGSGAARKVVRIEGDSAAMVAKLLAATADIAGGER